MILTNENYYSAEANKEFFSASQVKDFMKCEASAVAYANGTFERESSQALMVGSYVDSYFEGTLDQFKERHPEILKRDGTLKAEYVNANAMISRARLDKTFMDYCQGETQRIFTGEIAGVPFKSKFDFYVPGERIVDLKTVKDMQPMYKPGVGKVSPIEYWNWHLQMAIYQELEGHKLPCYLAIITKENPPALHLVQIDQSVMDTELELLKEKLPRFEALKAGVIEPERCEDCAYCRISKTITEPEIFKYIEEE